MIPSAIYLSYFKVCLGWNTVTTDNNFIGSISVILWPSASEIYEQYQLLYLHCYANQPLASLLNAHIIWVSLITVFNGLTYLN
jgi:hypothetical protein